MLITKDTDNEKYCIACKTLVKLDGTDLVPNFAHYSSDTGTYYTCGDCCEDLE